MDKNFHCWSVATVIGILIFGSFILDLNLRLIRECFAFQEPGHGTPEVTEAVIAKAPKDSLLVPVKVKAEMIDREAPIYLSYTLKQKAQVRVLLINEKGDVVKSFLPHTTLAGSESVTNLGRWSDVKAMGNYTIAIATDKPAYETFAKVGVANGLRKIVTEMNVVPQKGKKFQISYKLDKTSNVKCQSIHSKSQKVAWQSDEKERPEGQLHYCKEWDAGKEVPGAYYAQIVATLLSDPASGPDRETKPLEVIK